MPATSQVIKRHFAMLEHVPRAPGCVKTLDLQQQIEHTTRKEISVRSIQRDLMKLQDAFPHLEYKREDRTYYWFWSKDAPQRGFPAMDVYTALGFRFMEDRLYELLPPTVLKHFKPYFSQSRSLLVEHGEGDVARWQERVCDVTGDLPRKAPDIPATVSGPVYEALFEGRQLEITYQKPGEDRPQGKPYILHPLALIPCRKIIYLVARAWNYKEPRLYALPRIRTARKLMASANQKNFRLDDYIERGEVEVTLGPDPLQLRLSVSREAAFYLREQPLSEDQKIEPAGRSASVVTATVRDTRALRRWLLGQCEWVTVLGPAPLRRELSRILAKAQAGYTPVRLPPRKAIRPSRRPGIPAAPGKPEAGRKPAHRAPPVRVRLRAGGRIPGNRRGP